MTHDELRSLVEIKKDDLLNLCSDIIRIPSVNPPGDTDEMVQFICDYLKSHNIEYEIASGDGKTKNILARLGKKGGRVLILNGHCDVVPVSNLDRWDFDPFCGDIKDGKILGRGTSDMKGGLTGLLFAMGLLADNNIDLNGEVLLTVVPDEEAFGQGGTKWLVESGTVTGDACLIAEPTGYYNCEIGQKGTCSIKLMAHGTPAHGSLAPFIGDNAICKLLAVLNKVDCIRDIVPVMDDETARVMEQSRELAKRLIKAHGAQQVLNHCTVNIGKISGGTKVNMVPDYAEAEIDVRLPLGVSCDMVEERLIRILHEVGLTIKKGETHVLMGPNGAGKSTLGYVLTGNPKYSVTEGKILFKGNDITEEAADKRAKAGMFLSFQEPLEVPGLSLESFIRSALSEQGRNKMRVWNFRKELKAAMEVLHMDPSYAGRDLNVGFSGGEKKKSEILQLMMLKPDLAILDETDSGLDVDAVRLASEGIREYQKENPDGALLIITHSTRILDALHVDATHIMVNGHIVASGDASLVDKINREGYEEYEKLAQKGEDER